jgi:hypothetical protein
LDLVFVFVLLVELLELLELEAIMPSIPLACCLRASRLAAKFLGLGSELWEVDELPTLVAKMALSVEGVPIKCSM